MLDVVSSICQSVVKSIVRSDGDSFTGYIDVSDATPDQGDTITLEWIDTNTPQGALSISDNTPDQGDTVTLEFTPVAYTYQWKKDGVNIGGETTSQLELANIAPADDGDYTVLVTNTVNSRSKLFGPESIVVTPTPKLLDTYDTAVAAFSLEDIGPTGYSGHVIRIRHEVSAAELDIDSFGAIAIAAAEAHCGVSGGAVRTWYDLSGTGNNLVQADTNQQPQFVVDGGDAVTVGGKAAIEFTDDSLAAIFTLSQPCTIFSVFKAGVYDAGEQAACNTVLDGGAGQVIIRRTSATVADVGSMSAAFPIANNEVMVVALKVNGASSAIWKNGVSNATGDMGASGLGGITLDSYQQVLRYGSNTHLCLLVFPSAMSDANLEAISLSLMDTFGVT